MRVVVLGSSGMLGQAVVKKFRENPEFETISISRGLDNPDFGLKNLAEIFELIPRLNPAYIINCIGIIKPYINSESDSILKAVEINSIFPQKLANTCKNEITRIIQIATDCVFSGKVGGYIETNDPDPTDVYGMTKYLGEVNSANFMNLRCSIVGPNIYSNTSLYNWVSGFHKGANVNGFVNHFWNGVTTYAFAEVVERIIISNLFRPGTFHLVPADHVTKYELVTIIANHLDRKDLTIQKTESEIAIDRRLGTNDNSLNCRFWGVSNNSELPKIASLKFGV